MNKWMYKMFSYLVSARVQPACCILDPINNIDGGVLQCQDRFFVQFNSKPSLQEAGMEAFKTVLYDRIKSNVVSAMLDLVTRERNGEVVDTQMLKVCVEIFASVGANTSKSVYEDFEVSIGSLSVLVCPFSLPCIPWLRPTRGP